MPINQHFSRFPFDKAIQSIDQFKVDVKAQLHIEAKEYQHEVANYMQEHFKRKGDSTGRLVSATLDTRNAVFGAASWHSPNAQFLSQSTAKYWRLIEQGSEGLYAHGRGFRGTPLRLRPGGFPGGRPFRSIGPANAGYPNNVWRGSGGDRKRVQSLVFVSHEIQPMHAYAIVYGEGGWRERMRRDFQKIAKLSFQR